MARRGILAKALLYTAAGLALFLSLQRILQAEWSVEHTRARAGQIPIEIFSPRDANTPQPVVIIAHGFSACKQYMYPFAYTFARNGYVAAVFDFSGHGKNPTSFPYTWEDVHRDTSPLTHDLDLVIDHVRGLSEVDPDRIALLGYSMGSAIVSRYARDAQGIIATIAVSTVFSDVLPAQPSNLLLLTGAWETRSMKATARAALKASGGGDEDMVNGSFADGTARKLAFVPFVEHASIPFSRRTTREAMAWLDGAFGHSSTPSLDDRLPWVALALASGLILFFPLSGILLQAILPQSGQRESSPLEIAGFLLATLLPAIAAPALLRFVPYRILPLSAGDYVVTSLLIQGILMLGLLLATGSLDRARLRQLVTKRATLAAAALFVALVVPLGLILEFTMLSVFPILQRMAIIAAAFSLIAPYFLASEYVARTRYPGFNRLFPIVAKAALLASLGAGALLGGPYVLVLFLPGIALLLLAIEIISRRVYALTSHPGVSGILTALIFAWTIGVLFPLT